MKIYKVKSWISILITCGFLFIFVIGGIIFLIYSKEATLLHQTIIFVAILIGIGGIYILNNSKVIIDEEKIEVTLRLGQKLLRRTLLWSEIEELDSGYVLFPEGGYVSLKPKVGLFKKLIHIPLSGMPIQLVRDILSYLPPNTKVYLYPYLKRKVEGKQTWFYRR